MQIAELSACDWEGLASRLTQLLNAGDDASRSSPLLSLTLDLGAAPRRWCEQTPLTDDLAYWARADRGDYRLALGRALSCTSAGPSRFASLEASWRGISTDWLHDDLERTGHRPQAHLGFAFDDSEQAVLPNAQLLVPAVLLQTRNGRSSATFTCTRRTASDALLIWQRLLQAQATPSLPPPLASDPGKESLLSRRAFCGRVSAALSAIDQSQVDKLVLARNLNQRAAGPLPPFALLSALLASTPESTVFAVQRGASTFLGASPEQLFALRAGQVEADALAGTDWPLNITQPLLDEKNGHEQQLVTQAVLAALQSCCSHLSEDLTPTIRQQGHLSHLCTSLRGQLNPGQHLFDLLTALHPTPAVGGWPRQAALQWLRRHGEQRRAWYSGGFGWLEAAHHHQAASGNVECAEVIVPLRCALIHGDSAELQAGAGIVAASQAEREFAETSAKFGVLLRAWQAHAETASSDAQERRA